MTRTKEQTKEIKGEKICTEASNYGKKQYVNKPSKLSLPSAGYIFVVQS